MQAIILAAGMGKRLGELTKHNTKCMVEVHNKPLLERSLDCLLTEKISKVIIVIGYEGDQIRNLIGSNYKGMKIEYVENTVYDKTNNIYSLYLAREAMTQEDTLLLESDLIFDQKILSRVIEDPYPNLAVVAKYQSWMDGTVVTLDKEDNILSFIPKQHFDYQDIHKYYKTVNIYKLSKEFSSSHYVPFLEAYCKALGNNEYYEQVLRVITLLEKPDLKALRLTDEKWYEIDDIQDLKNAEIVFAEDKNRLQLYQNRHGGYWRFPFLKDFCYLVNPYFPTDRMENEIKCYFHTLVSEYPSALNCQNLLASKHFECSQDQILTGNGAAELINALTPTLKGVTGIISPTFNEYPERFGTDKCKYLVPNNEDFAYSKEDLITFSEEVDNLLLINPDNPSGHFIPINQVLELAQFLALKGKTLILDESFVDFTNEGPSNSLINKDILQRNKNMIIIKSISKSYGVPGIRLGVLACGDTQVIENVRANVSIWNINSFGEFFLQIIGKYTNDYAQACQTISNERDRLFKELQQIPFLRVIPSQANYFLCEVTNGIKATQLTNDLLRDQDILIKDLTGKKGFEGKQYIRIAVRNSVDNDIIVQSLKKHEMVIGICGGGNISHSLIGIMAHNKDLEIRLLTRKPGEWSRQIKVERPGMSSLTGTIHKISDQPQSIIPGCDIVILCLPAPARDKVVQQIAPWIDPKTWVGSFPGMGNFDMICRKYIPLKEKNIRLFASQRVPCISRIREYGKVVCMTSKKDSMAIAALNPINTSQIAAILSPILDQEIICLNHYLEVTLSTSNPVLHPARMYNIFKDYNKDKYYSHKILFYENWDIESSQTLINIDNEVHQIINKIPLNLSGIIPLLKHYDSWDAESLTRKISGIAAFKGIQAPMKKTPKGYIPDLESRYFNEDIVYGLLIIKDIAQIFNSPTPTIDKVIIWAQELMQQEFISGNSLNGKDCKGLPLHSVTGITKIAEFLEFYK